MVNTERSVYYREHAAGYYSVFPFYFAMVSPILTFTHVPMLVQCCSGLQQHLLRQTLC